MTNRPTLYDDWRARREHLATLPYWAGDYHAVEMRLLDYLLRRYRDSPEAARPVRFPAMKDFYVDHRAIVVMHHLGGGHIPTIRNRFEAQAHVRSILRRMSSQSAEDAPTGPGPGAADCDHGSDANRVEMLRIGLCGNDPTARVLATIELAELGTLGDIGLLSDLLSLPKSTDEHPRERAALVHAMQRLAGVTGQSFDLAEVVPRSAPEAQDGPPDDEPPDWVCSKCRAEVPANHEICWRCGTSIKGVEDSTFHRLDEQ